MRVTLIAALGCLLAGGIVGFLIGRASNKALELCRKLEAELAEAREAQARYRSEVAQHFARTSDLVKSLTLQYRAVYEHLADGARSLCPDSVPEIGRGVAGEPLLLDDRTPPARSGSGNGADELSGRSDRAHEGME
jgi:hypothetical protein